METRAFALIREYNGHEYIDVDSIGTFSQDVKAKIANDKDKAIKLAIVTISDVREVEDLV